MPTLRVYWETDVFLTHAEVDNLSDRAIARKAAEEAQAMIRDPDSIATIFMVRRVSAARPRSAMPWLRVDLLQQEDEFGEEEWYERPDSRE